MTGKVLQFGTGRFLRGFIDPIFNDRTVTVIQSRVDAAGADQINAAGERGYRLWVRGKQNGEIVDRVEEIRSLSKALVAANQWKQIIDLSLDPELSLIVSNTTEAGLQLDDRDQGELSFNVAPHSYPARLATILSIRFKVGAPGLTILPMELVEGNGEVLKRLVIQQAKIYSFPEKSNFIRWLNEQNRWLPNLVDRIVVGVSDDPPWEADDPLAIVAEPFAMLAIKDDGGDRSVLPAHPMIGWYDDLTPLFVRKVRILNGLHTAMVARCLPQGIETVKQAISDPEHRRWLEGILREEILPTLSARGIDAHEFAATVIERFENPFFQHHLADIANGHAAKLQTRIAPTVTEFEEEFGKSPEKLSWVLNAELPTAKDLHV